MERQGLRREVQGLREQLAGEGQFGRMIGVSPEMRELFQTATRVAESELPVLLLGESGTGKESAGPRHPCTAVAGRASARWLTVNCAALPESLIESELFGYEKGAFTGAMAARAGRFEAAHRRHVVSRRDRRHGAGHAGQDSARRRVGDHRAAGRHAAHIDRCSPDQRRPT